jgi:hypothetical protein
VSREEAAYFARLLERVPVPQWGPFRPFRVTVGLRTPISVTTPWIAFDGLLFHLRLQDVLGRDFYLLPAKFNLADHLSEQHWTIPLAKTGPVWHGSASVFEPETAVRVTRTYKRFEDRWTEHLAIKRVQHGRGHYRAYMMAQPYIPAHTVAWWGCGDIAEVERLLRTYVVALGNDHRVGWGAVSTIRVEEVPEDLSLIRDGRASRTLPVSMCKSYQDATYLAVRPPYWHPGNVALCVPPGVPCRLKEVVAGE